MALNPEVQALYDTAAGNATKPAESAESSPSLAEHEAAFSNSPRFAESPSPGEAPDDTAEPPQPRHRARSQVAKPEDVEAINALTKRLKDAEAAAGIHVEREDGESDRVYNLRRRAVLAESLVKPKTPAPQPQTPAQPPTAFAEAEPTIEQFATAPDPYTAWQRALGAYDRRKEAAEAQTAESRAAVERQQASTVEAKRRAYAEFNGRVEVFKQTTPDYQSVVDAVSSERPCTYLMETALVNDPDGARYVYELAKNPALHDELFMLTDNKPVNRDTVASVQRLLKARILAAPTGSAVPLTRPLAPRPPNPVRTVPSAHLPNKAPTDTASLADHEAFYGSSRRR